MNIKEILELADSDTRKDLIEKDEFKIFRRAITKGDHALMSKLWQLCTKDQREKMLCARNFSPARRAARRKNIRIVQQLLSWAEYYGKHEEMIASKNFALFRCATKWARSKADIHTLVTLFWLKRDVELRKKMLAANHFEVLCWKKNFFFAKDLFKWFGDKTQYAEIFKTNNFSAFRSAAYKDEAEFITQIFAFSNDEDCKAMISSKNFKGFRKACSRGYIETVIVIFQKSDLYQQKEMIRAKNFEGFRKAAAHGHGKVLSEIIHRAKGDKSALESMHKIADELTLKETKKEIESKYPALKTIWKKRSAIYTSITRDPSTHKTASKRLCV